MTGRRGRRPGSPDTRAGILEVARKRFAESGFSATSMRGVASDAGVDPSLVHHYFGSKDELFLAAMRVPIDPRKVVGRMLEGGAEDAGERLVRTVLSVWDDEENRLPLLALARAVTEPGGDQLFRDGMMRVVLGPIAQGLGLDRPQLRMELVASQVLGLVMIRYVLGVDPLASLPSEKVVRIYAPTFQRYLTGPLSD